MGKGKDVIEPRQRVNLECHSLFGSSSLAPSMCTNACCQLECSRVSTHPCEQLFGLLHACAQSDMRYIDARGRVEER